MKEMEILNLHVLALGYFVPLKICLLQWLQEEENHENSEEEEIPELTKWEAIGWLAILTVWVSVLSGYLVDAIQVKWAKCIFTGFEFKG